jgi:hypothetical protein
LRKLLPMIFAAALCVAPCLRAENAEVAGKWQMTVQSPHGPVRGPLDLKQEGAKFTGAYQTAMFGTSQVSGKVEGQGISFTLELPQANMSFNFTGTLDGDSMSGTFAPNGGSWSATRNQAIALNPVLGTVTQFKIPTLEMGVRPDQGEPVFLKFGPETEALRVPPGDQNLEHAQPIAMTASLPAIA